jgi:putative endonuclease
LVRHRLGTASSFTKRYNIWKLVYAEAYEDVLSAIDREKQLKRWRRSKKLDLIASVNPDWDEIPAS